MTTQAMPDQGISLDLGDIYYVLFRHKWKIIMCSLLGIAGAVALYRNEVPPYQSEAKLLVRYITTEKNSRPSVTVDKAVITPDDRGATIMNTEIEILNSLDLAKEVATAVGPERILAKAGGGNDPGAATAMVRGGLSVTVAPQSSVIHIIYRHPDPELVQPILREVIERYFKLHVEAHRSSGMLGDSLASGADTLKMRLSATEEELRKVMNSAGINSLEGAKEDYSRQTTGIKREILNYETELAGKLAIFEDIKKRNPAVSAANKGDGEPEIPTKVVDNYRSLSARLNRLQNQEQDYLTQFTADSARVKSIHNQIVETEADLNKLREEYPKLFRTAPSTEPRGASDAEAAEAAASWLQITSYQAKIKELISQLERIKDESAKLDRLEGRILELRRQKELEEANYRYYASTLEQNRISEVLGEGKISNISRIQEPSSPYRDRPNMKKVGFSLIGGVMAGLAWAFLIELYFDRSVRRPVDLQRRLRLPLFLSIPRLKMKTPQLNAGAALLTNGSSSDGKLATRNGESAESSNGATGPLRVFHETLRDRLIGYFENRNLIHKPKLIAVTSLRADAGVTTTATGLARSLSETGEGNVLLVDMTAGQGSAQQFAKGKEICGLDELLEARTQAHVHENLYVVSESSNSERLSRSLPQRFAKLVPKLKASDFDYIIFDMPAVNQLSITPRLAGFMDMVLLVIESEKTDREIVQGACALLAESKAQVGIVLNKTKNYVPFRLQQQLTTS